MSRRVMKVGEGIFGEFEWDEWTWLNGITILMTPLVFLLHLWLPWVDEGKYYRWFYVVNPIFAVLFIFTSFSLWGSKFITSGGVYLGHAYYWFLPPAFILSFLVALTTSNDKPPVYNLVFVIGSMLMSMATINSLARELVEILGVLGDSWQISSAILGLTVLGWGNSIGDFVSNVIVAKKGLSSMAIAACLSAPFSNMLVGIGMATLITTISKGGPIELKTGTFEPDLTNIHFIGFVSIITSLLIFLISGVLLRFTIPRWFAGILMPMYATFLLLSILVELHVIPIGYSLWNVGFG